MIIETIIIIVIIVIIIITIIIIMRNMRGQLWWWWWIKGEQWRRDRMSVLSLSLALIKDSHSDKKSLIKKLLLDIFNRC